MLTKGQSKARRKRPASALNSTIFDREHLRQYTAEDRALERELIGLFLGQFAPIRSQLDEAASAEDWKFAAHSLKGSARSIGAPQIAALAGELEVIGHGGPKKGTAKVLARLDVAMAAFATEVEKILE